MPNTTPKDKKESPKDEKESQCSEDEAEESDDSETEDSDDSEARWEDVLHELPWPLGGLNLVYVALHENVGASTARIVEKTEKVGGTVPIVVSPRHDIALKGNAHRVAQIKPIIASDEQDDEKHTSTTIKYTTSQKN